MPKPKRLRAPQGDSVYVHVPDATRQKFISAIATMPDEAYGWLVLATQAKAMTLGGNVQIWPDGIGGFMEGSRASITAIREAAAEWIDEQGRLQRDREAPRP
jgi:hypothetical protein